MSLAILIILRLRPSSRIVENTDMSPKCADSPGVSDQSQSYGGCGRLRPVMGSELGVDGGDVRLHRAPANVEGVANLPVGVARAEQTQDLLLPRRERGGCWRWWLVVGGWS